MSGIFPPFFLKSAPMGAPLAKCVPVCVAQNGKEHVALAPKPLDIGIGLAQARHGHEDVNDRIGGQALH